MPPTIVETDLKEILGSIQKDLKDIRDDLTDLKVSQAEIRGDIANLKTELTLTREDVKDLKGRATAQIWTLIGLISSVITAIVAAAVKLGFFSNPYRRSQSLLINYPRKQKRRDVTLSLSIHKS